MWIYNEIFQYIKKLFCVDLIKFLVLNRDNWLFKLYNWNFKKMKTKFYNKLILEVDQKGKKIINTL